VSDTGIALLRFRAGEVSLGVAAGAARGFSQPKAGLIHVGDLLGIEVAALQDGRRTLEVHGLTGEARVLVDGPVGLATIGPSDILARPVGLPVGASPLVVGFASAGQGRIIMLIDVERLIAVAQERAAAGRITEGRDS
jgi:hypothetical protein